MRLLLSRRHHPGSVLIRSVTWSSWSHVDVLIAGDAMIAAAASHGVSYYSLRQRLDQASSAILVDVPVPDEAAAQEWARSQIGKPYDWLGVIGLGLHRDWETDEAWWCSEFAMRAAKEGGYAPYRSSALRRLVPEHIWLLNLPYWKLK